MNRIIPMLGRIYARVLRLYPPQFRTTFADEMCFVFTQAVQENHSPFSLFRFVCREIACLPLSILREHLHEYRKTPALSEGENSMITPPLFRWTTRGSLAFFFIFALLVILPFFVFGLHLQPGNLVSQGMFDPKGYPLYSTNLGSILLMLTYVVMLTAPVWGLTLSLASALTLRKQWIDLRLNQRIVGATAILAGTALLLFPLSPLGRIVYLWLLD